jgi:nitroimidazol reductase NimA-like FMN-containing flavoprotein (pyridoxamine 5'-phosphate oxidase superfamily)
MALLGQSRVGRVGISVRALPVILPVNFILFDGDVVIRTIPGTKLQAATSGSVVAFEADGFETDGSQGWSVVVQGLAQEIVEPEVLRRLGELPLHAWALNGTADRFVRIETAIVTGRRFNSPHPQA